ncbi:TrbM/KikA/MpfK family conjugal transfer protein [Gilliamella sp. BG6]|uniref:TrbM/KikA/MpfK family conjugal transfer protein n=1 Tax=unclassified Gilliamella TaxID=2685620 RepID=UPI003987F7D0
MKKNNIIKSLCLLIVFSFVPNLAFAEDELTGDKRTACEVILCLSSSQGKHISECKAPLKKYFSIKAKKWKDTLKKRRNFLDLCPAANENAKMSALTTAIQNQEYACDAETLNSRKLTKYSFIKDKNTGRTIRVGYIKIDSYFPRFCNDLFNHEFTEYHQLKKPKFVCDTNKWYTQKDWNRGFEKVEISRKWNFRKNAYDIKYKEVPIKKNCWE